MRYFTIHNSIQRLKDTGDLNAATLDMLTAALQMEGYQVYNLADNQENALEMIRRYRPKLFLLDCWLSNYSSGQVGQRIKADFPKLPVVAFSCDNQIREKYRQLGFDDYIKKPFDLDLLYRVVRKHLHRRGKRSRGSIPA
jgi:DNA-binding response OmpR family regulator